MTDIGQRAAKSGQEPSRTASAHRGGTIERGARGAEPRIQGGDGAMGRDVLALACPDWRDATLTVDAGTGEIIYANMKALALMGAGGPARLIKDRFVFRQPEAQRQFLRSLETSLSDWTGNVVFLARHDAADTWLSVTVRKPEGLYRDILQRRFGDVRISSRLVFVEFSSGAVRPGPKTFAAFAAAFGLTGAESELAGMLASGKSLAEIAVIRGAAISTIRQRAKQLLAKTGSKRQSDIVRLVLSLR